MAEIEYIDGKKSNGLSYNFREINKIYKSLKCPKGYYNPIYLPFDKAKYFNIMSVRATGKTTNILLWCMCVRKWYEDKYGFDTPAPAFGYIRQTIDMIMPKNIKDMFSVIIDNKYVQKLTNDTYNSIIYKNRAFYYALVDDKGDVVEIDNQYICFCFALNRRLEYKSSFNNPKLDFCIYDEYISERYVQNEFIDFIDLLATIFRERKSPLIFMLANNIDRHSPYFRELGISEQIKLMDFGDSKIITSEMGTKVYVELLGLEPSKQKQKKELTQLFYGFSNPKLSIITGQMTWAVNNYQHIPSDLEEDVHEICGNRYILFNDELVRLRLVTSEKYGRMVLVTPATRTHDDSIIYTIDDLQNKRYRYGFGYSNLDKLFYKAYTRNQFYYAHNDVGGIVENFIKAASKAR